MAINKRILSVLACLLLFLTLPLAASAEITSKAQLNNESITVGVGQGTTAELAVKEELPKRILLAGSESCRFRSEYSFEWFKRLRQPGPYRSELSPVFLNFHGHRIREGCTVHVCAEAQQSCHTGLEYEKLRIIVFAEEEEVTENECTGIIR